MPITQVYLAIDSSQPDYYGLNRFFADMGPESEENFRASFCERVLEQNCRSLPPPHDGEMELPLVQSQVLDREPVPSIKFISEE